MDHAAADGRDDAPLILIVDDERDIADMLESYFRLEGYRTIVAHDAAGALAAAPSRVPPSPSGGVKGRGRSPRPRALRLPPACREARRRARGGQRSGRRRNRACDALRTGGSRQPGVKLRRQHDENAILC